MSDPHEFRGFGHDPFPATPSKGEPLAWRYREVEPDGTLSFPKLSSVDPRKFVSDAREIEPLFASPTSRGEDRSFAAAIEALAPFAALAVAPDVLTNFGTTIQHAPDSYMACGLNISIAHLRRAHEVHTALSSLSKARRAGSHEDEREKAIEECCEALAKIIAKADAQIASAEDQTAKSLDPMYATSGCLSAAIEILRSLKRSPNAGEPEAQRFSDDIEDCLNDPWRQA